MARRRILRLPGPYNGRMADPDKAVSRRWLAAAVGACLLGVACSANAFVTYPFSSGNETLYLKWGDNHAATPGGTVYWSFIPPGTPGSASYCGDACPGSSVSAINVEISPGGGFAATPLTALESHITAMMARWSAVSGIDYVKLPADSGVPINDPSALPSATGQIRIGVFAFASSAGEAAVGYAPPPNGGSGAGDILFNANAYFQFAPGNENDSYDTTYGPNDFDGLLLHELGHALGLAHTPDDGTHPVMCVDASCLARIKRQLTADDIAGAVFLYDRIYCDGFE